MFSYLLSIIINYCLNVTRRMFRRGEDGRLAVTAAKLGDIPRSVPRVDLLLKPPLRSGYGSPKRYTAAVKATSCDWTADHTALKRRVDTPPEIRTWGIRLTGSFGSEQKARGYKRVLRNLYSEERSGLWNENFDVLAEPTVIKVALDAAKHDYMNLVCKLDDRAPTARELWFVSTVTDTIDQGRFLSVEQLQQLKKETAKPPLMIFNVTIGDDDKKTEDTIIKFHTAASGFRVKSAWTRISPWMPADSEKHQRLTVDTPLKGAAPAFMVFGWAGGPCLVVHTPFRLNENGEKVVDTSVLVQRSLIWWWVRGKVENLVDRDRSGGWIYTQPGVFEDFREYAVLFPELQCCRFIEAATILEHCSNFLLRSTSNGTMAMLLAGLPTLKGEASVTDEWIKANNDLLNVAEEYVLYSVNDLKPVQLLTDLLMALDCRVKYGANPELSDIINYQYDVVKRYCGQRINSNHLVHRTEFIANAVTNFFGPGGHLRNMSVAESILYKMETTLEYFKDHAISEDTPDNFLQQYDNRYKSMKANGTITDSLIKDHDLTTHSPDTLVRNLPFAWSCQKFRDELESSLRAQLGNDVDLNGNLPGVVVVEALDVASRAIMVARATRATGDRGVAPVVELPQLQKMVHARPNPRLDSSAAIPLLELSKGEAPRVRGEAPRVRLAKGKRARPTPDDTDWRETKKAQYENYAAEVFLPVDKVNQATTKEVWASTHGLVTVTRHLWNCPDFFTGSRQDFLTEQGTEEVVHWLTTRGGHDKSSPEFRLITYLAVLYVTKLLSWIYAPSPQSVPLPRWFCPRSDTVNVAPSSLSRLATALGRATNSVLKIDQDTWKPTTSRLETSKRGGAKLRGVQLSFLREKLVIAAQAFKDVLSEGWIKKARDLYVEVDTPELRAEVAGMGNRLTVQLRARRITKREEDRVLAEWGLKSARPPKPKPKL